MSSGSLFRKWRSQDFSDLVGQDAVVKTLSNILTSGNPARAYLFSGPRGTGKTSSARIFAKALNCENGPTAQPCNKCPLCVEITNGTCLDVFEIDAASHTQVDKIREFIVDKVNFAPVRAKYKVYVIDEVHKLSSSSFNALLKTLEEPPPHVVFILCTTHPHELPPTILSRCQRHNFTAIPLGVMRSRLLQVAEAEGIDLELAAADKLARAADGSLRDALVLLEQVQAFAGNVITEEQVSTLLGLVEVGFLDDLVESIQDRDAVRALKLLASFCDSGGDLKRLNKSLLEYLRKILLLKTGAADLILGEPSGEEELSRKVAAISLPALMRWIKLLLDASHISQSGLESRIGWELLLVQMIHPEHDENLAAINERLSRLESVAVGGKGDSATISTPKLSTVSGTATRPQECSPAITNTKKAVRKTKTGVTEKKGEQQKGFESVPSSANGEVSEQEFWSKFVREVRRKDKRLFGVLTDAKLVELNSERLILSVPKGYSWHQQAVMSSKKVLQGICKKLLGRELGLECRIEEAEVVDSEREHADLIKKATRLFGGEIIEG